MGNKRRLFGGISLFVPVCSRPREQNEICPPVDQLTLTIQLTNAPVIRHSASRLVNPNK